MTGPQYRDLVREAERRQLRLTEDMHVRRPFHRAVRARRTREVVIARREDHRHRRKLSEQPAEELRSVMGIAIILVQVPRHAERVNARTRSEADRARSRVADRLPEPAANIRPSTAAGLRDLGRGGVTRSGHRVIMPGLCGTRMILRWPRAIA